MPHHGITSFEGGGRVTELKTRPLPPFTYDFSGCFPLCGEGGLLLCSGVVSVAKLTDKQKRFVDEYLVDLNATAAAKREDQIPEQVKAQRSRRLIETAVYDACFRHRTEEITSNIRKCVTHLAQAYANNASAEEFNQLLEDEDIYVAKNCGNEVFYKLMQTIILLRREAALKICESPYNRKTSVEKRKNVAFAFECGDHKAFLKAINAFFDESVKDFTFDR